MTMRTLLLPVALLLAAFPAKADDDRVPAVRDPRVLKECGSCHMAFQPAFLPARSWNRIMDGLANHFGDNATLPGDAVQAIRAYLTTHAGDAGARSHGQKSMRAIPLASTPLRITETPAFQHEHRFPDAVWKDPKIVTRSNCPACHAGAEQGWYEDD